jgi:ferredoxin
MRITIDESRCIAAGQCVLNAPELFDQRDEDGIVVLLDASPPGAEQPAARLAAQLCPAQVISLDD